MSAQGTSEGGILLVTFHSEFLSKSAKRRISKRILDPRTYAPTCDAPDHTSPCAAALAMDKPPLLQMPIAGRCQTREPLPPIPRSPAPRAQPRLPLALRSGRLPAPAVGAPPQKAYRRQSLFSLMSSNRV